MIRGLSCGCRIQGWGLALPRLAPAPHQAGTARLPPLPRSLLPDSPRKRPSDQRDWTTGGGHRPWCPGSWGPCGLVALWPWYTGPWRHLSASDFLVKQPLSVCHDSVSLQTSTNSHSTRLFTRRTKPPSAPRPLFLNSRQAHVVCRRIGSAPAGPDKLTTKQPYNGHLGASYILLNSGSPCVCLTGHFSCPSSAPRPWPRGTRPSASRFLIAAAARAALSSVFSINRWPPSIPADTGPGTWRQWGVIEAMKQ